MVGGVFVGQQADLLQRVEDQAVVAEADVVSVAFLEDARLDAVGPAVGEAVLDHVAGKFFHAQSQMVTSGGVAAVLVAELPDGIGEGQHSIHEDAADGVSQAADAGVHSFAQDLGGLITG